MPDENRSELFRALFHEDGPTDRQVDEARRAFRRRPRPRFRRSSGDEELLNLKRRLQKRRAELLSGSPGVRELLDDPEVRELLTALRDRHTTFAFPLEGEPDCGDLPPLRDLTSRLHPGESPEPGLPATTFTDTEVVGTGGLNQAEADVTGATLRAAAWSNSSGIAVSARASLFLYLSPAITTHDHDYVIRAHLAGASQGSALHVMSPSPDEFRYSARAELDALVWDESGGRWTRADVDESVRLDRRPNLSRPDAAQAYDGFEPFQESLEVRIDAARIPHLFGSVLVGITAAATAAAPVAHFDPRDRFPSQASARSRLDMTVCAVDVGFVPRSWVIRPEHGISVSDVRALLEG